MSAPELIRNLSLILTNRCNLNCEYCYQNSGGSRRMSAGTLETALDLVLRSSHRQVKVGFSGGEPLLEFPMVSRAVAYCEARRRPAKQIEYSISTNGTLLTEEIAAFLDRHRFDTQISFDGIAAAQNHRGKNTFPGLDALLDRLYRDLPGFFRSRLTIALTLTSANCGHLAESVAYFINKGVMQIAITPAVTPDPGWRDSRVDTLESQFERIYEMSLRRYHDTGETPLKIFQDKYDGFDTGTIHSEMCGIVRGESLVVDVDGQAYGCTLLAASYQTVESAFLRNCIDSLCMGSIHDSRIEERHASFPEAARRMGLFHNKENKYSSYGRCADCPAAPECSACPLSIAHVPGNNDPNRISDLVCAYNRVSRACRKRFPSRPAPRSTLAFPPELCAEMERWERIADAIKERKRAG